MAERLSAGVVLGERFEVERVAGVGGMGTVYRARDLLTGEPAAVKVLLPTADTGRFAREARLLESVRHPSVVRYVGEGATADGAPYLVMEWLDGEELVARLEHGHLTVGETIDLARRVAGVLAVLHARGALHRDVKPSNLFLAGGRIDQLKVLDFGIAVAHDASQPLTRSGITLGTPGYMAPEQARGDRDIDGRADLFSLGCVLFECLTGRPAFTGVHVIALLTKVLLEDAPRVTTLRADVPEPLADLVAALLQKRREDRPAYADAVLLALDAIEVGSVPPPSSWSQRPPKLTADEQRLLSVILVGGRLPPAVSGGVAEAATLPLDAFRLLEPLREVAAAHRAALAPLADGTLVLALSSAGAATDRAALSARCALAARRVAADATIILAMGRGQAGGSLPAGEVAERAAGLLARGLPRPAAGGASAPIWIDELTAGLLGERFVIDGDGDQLALRGEREIPGEDGRFLGRRVRCMGRDRELRALEEAFDTSVSEPCARAVIVVGEAGVGKSRLQTELARTLEERGGPVERWLARGDPSSAGSPFGQIGQAIRRAAGVLDGEPIEERRRKLLARSGRHLGDQAQRVAEFLGELAGVPFPDEQSPHLRAARHDRVSMGDQMRGAWFDWLEAECRVQPVVLVLEDLHWGDLPTVQFVDAALRLLCDRPLLVVALARPEVMTRFPGLWSKRAPIHLHVGGLSRRACAELTRDVLGDGVSAATLDRLWEHSAGNAFFLEELLRAEVGGHGAGAPATVLAMVQARLEGLSSEARRVLRAGAIFGQRFWRGGLAALLGGAAPLDEILAALVDDEVIVRAREAKFPGETELAFRHALVREAAYGMLTEADRAVGHRLAGEWLAGAGEGDAKLLADHFERGGRPLDAARWYRRAAEQALEGNDYALVVTLAEQALTCAGNGFDARWQGELYLLEAVANRFQGEVREMRSCASEAVALLPRGSAPFCRAIEAIAHASGLLQDPEGLAAAMRDLLCAEVAFDAEDLASEGMRELGAAYAISLARTGGHGILGGQATLGSVLLRRSEEVAAGLPDDAAVSAALRRAQALEVHFKGDLGTTLRLHTAAHAGFQATGDLRNAAIEAGNIGCAQVRLGALSEAERVLRAVLVDTDRLGLAVARASALQDLGLAVALQGRFAEGIAIAEEAGALARYGGMRRHQLSSRFYVARIALMSGDVERAERESRVQLAEADALGSHRAHALTVLSAAAAALGRPAEALAAAVEAMEILAAEGAMEEGESLIRLAYAEALHAVGDARAPAALAAARQSVLERADRIVDAELRRSFLERVPENARTLALSSELTHGAAGLVGR